MASAKEHYAEHLGAIYSWMAGDFAALKARSAELFDRLGPAWLESVCAEAGLRTIERASTAGVITFVAVRDQPAP